MYLIGRCWIRCIFERLLPAFYYDPFTRSFVERFGTITVILMLESTAAALAVTFLRPAMPGNAMFMDKPESVV